MACGSGPLVKAVGLDRGKAPIMAETRGRILVHHALMYILEGEGFFEDKETPRQRVGAGTVFYQYPERWHYFDPDPGTTWTEYWVLFDGAYAEQAFGPLLPEHAPVHQIGLHAIISDAYEELYALWLREDPLQTVYAAYLLHRILAEVHMRVRGVSFRREDDLVGRARLRLQEALGEESFDFQALAAAENVSYEALRKRCKRETGMAPHQLFLAMKLNRAKAWLLRPELGIKEIAPRLGFQDPYYFSRLFRKKEGVAPQVFRSGQMKRRV